MKLSVKFTDSRLCEPVKGGKVLTNQELTAKVKEISLTYFKQSFDHEAKWNQRLRTTGGRFFPKDLHLDFNPKMAELKDFEGVILHELTHYHLYRSKRGYQHRDSDFKRLLSQVGGLRYAPSVIDKKIKYYYSCQNCGQLYPRQRKIDTKKYRCGKCRGKLILKTSGN